MGLFDVFSKKSAEGVPLVDRVIMMRQQGAPDEVIINQLQGEKIPMPQVQDAMMQADIKMRVAGPQMAPPGPPPGPEMEMPGPPAPPGMPPMGPPMGPMGPDMGPPPMGPPPYPQGPPPSFPSRPQPPVTSREGGVSTEELVEKMVREKTKDMAEKIREIESTRAEVKSQLQEFKEQLLELKSRYVQVQEESAVKIEEYNKELEGVGAQIKAMQRIMQNIIPALAENIRDLNDIVVEFKSMREAPMQAPSEPRPLVTSR